MGECLLVACILLHAVSAGRQVVLTALYHQAPKLGKYWEKEHSDYVLPLF